MKRALALGCIAFSLFACKKHVAAGGEGVGDPCTTQADCAAPLLCTSGACTLPAGLLACTPGALSCDGPDVIQCDSQGLHNVLVQTCPSGCSAGACIQAACTQGARRCGTVGVETCLPGEGGMLGWALSQACPQGCDPIALSCISLLCRPLDVRCSATKPSVVELCSGDGSKWLDEPCGAGATCSAGVCVTQRCTPGVTSCDGNVLVTCSADGTGYASQTPCTAGCSAGACTASVCSAGQSKCGAGDALLSCLPDGSGFANLQQCTVPPGCKTLSADRAVCGALLCSPLGRRCTADATAVQICAGDGSSWTTEAPCTNGCSNGACSPPPGGCAAGALRCAGNEVQRCDGTTWTTVADCAGSCSGGACSGGPSCAVGFTLSVPLPDCSQGAGADCMPPADGVSTLLAVTSVIADSSGAAVPDGTLVTVAATGGALIIAGDADPATPGTQVKTVGGVVDFAFRAPPATALSQGSSPSAQVQLSATVAGTLSCAATTQVTFVAPGTALFIAEDFTTQTFRDAAASNADWETSLGFVQQTSSEFGDGRDGPLTIPAGTSWDLTLHPRPGSSLPYAPVLRVTSVGSRSVVVEGQGAAAFRPGDEALLIELQGEDAINTLAAGSWELLTVAQSPQGEIDFTTNILGSYGERPGANLAGERVVLQRVPHFTDLNVPAGASLTASPWDGQRGGVLALRVAGRAAIAGSVQADALGYRAGAASDARSAQAGESFGGAAGAVANRFAGANLGGGSGGYLCGDPAHLNQIDTWYGSGGSYGSLGLSTCAGLGLTYGTPSLTRLLFGSGSGSQDQNTHQTCTNTTCPGEALVGHPAAVSRLTDGSCEGSDCSAFTSCAFESTTMHPNAIERTDGTCEGNDCSAFSVCGDGYTLHGTAIKKVSGACDGPDCTSFTSCANDTVGHKTNGAALPCNGDANCVDTIYTSCSRYSRNWADGSSCFANCPGLQGAHSDGATGASDACTSCGCTTWGFHDCYHDECFGNPSHCTQSAYRSDMDGCEATCSIGFSCPHSYDSCNSTGCGFLGLGSPCFQPVYRCWHGPGGPGGGQDCDYAGGSGCNNCSTCPHDEYTNSSPLHCTTNPGCYTNPGCFTKPGCNTHPGCSTCNGCDVTKPNDSCVLCPNPWQATAPGGRGGGIVFFAAGNLDLGGGGRVSASGGQPAGVARGAPAFAGGAGGSLFLRVGTLKLAQGGVQLLASGGAGGGDGRVRLDRAGGDDPIARGQIAPAPYQGTFALPQAQARSVFPSLPGKSATSATLAFALDAAAPSGSAGPSEQYLISGDGGKTPFKPVAVNTSVPFAPTTDVRWRVQLVPQQGVPARTQALLWLVRVQ